MMDGTSPTASRTSSLPDWLCSVGDALQRAQSTKDITAALAAATPNLGFEHFTLSTAIVGIDNVDWRLVISSAPPEFVRWYDKHDMSRKDPLLQRAYNTMEPFYADEVDLSHVDPALLELMRQAQNFGVGLVCCAQIHGHSGVSTVMHLTRRDAIRQDRQTVMRQAKWIVGHAHVALVRVVVTSVMESMKRAGELTAKERKCLELLARGHTIKDVAHRLSTSTSTVNYYLTKVMTKLGAHSGGRDEVIVKAIQRNEIDVARRARAWGASNTLVDVQAAHCPLTVPALDRILEGIEIAGNWAALADAAHAAACWAGCSNYAFVLREPDGDFPVQAVLSNYSGALRLVANDDEQCAHNPMVGGRRPRSMPFRWEEPNVLGEDEKRHLDDAMTSVWAAGAQVYGASCMNLSADGALSSFSIARTEPLPTENWCQTSYGLFLAARALHVRAQGFAKKMVSASELGDRELQVLRLLASGLDIKTIAARMRCSYGSVRWYSDRIVMRLNARNITHAISLAQQRNLLRGVIEFDKISDANHFLRA